MTEGLNNNNNYRCKPTFFTFLKQFLAAQVVLVVKDLTANAEFIRNLDLIPGYVKSPVGGHSNPL